MLGIITAVLSISMDVAIEYLQHCKLLILLMINIRSNLSNLLH
ncbi:unnamed protein product [Dracunculus medinensis]|uniref:Uncharacterized protein n=1 Tax=Dracunculus medinensis TaxID=318479 RepID=A0A0N4UJX7_DRAME|nr:unnamed protein product [Dracunculus medinensis]